MSAFDDQAESFSHQGEPCLSISEDPQMRSVARPAAPSLVLPAQRSRVWSEEKLRITWVVALPGLPAASSNVTSLTRTREQCPKRVCPAGHRSPSNREPHCLRASATNLPGGRTRGAAPAPAARAHRSSSLRMLRRRLTCPSRTPMWAAGTDGPDGVPSRFLRHGSPPGAVSESVIPAGHSGRTICWHTRCVQPVASFPVALRNPTAWLGDHPTGLRRSGPAQHRPAAGSTPPSRP